MDAEKLKIISNEERLKLMRAGKDQNLCLKYNDLEIPCRLLNAGESAKIIFKAKQKVKLPGNESDKVFSESHEVMVHLLVEACTVDNVPYANEEFIRQLTEPELIYLFDQYETMLNTINPTFERLTDEQKVEIINSVKKKKASSSEYFTWQLAEIGRYFLDQLLPMVKEPGS